VGAVLEGIWRGRGDPMTDQRRVAVVGGGRLGQYYAEAFSVFPDTELVALVPLPPHRPLHPTDPSFHPDLSLHPPSELHLLADPAT